MLRLLCSGALILTASAAVAQSIRYEVPEKAWPAGLGSHRSVVKVDKSGTAHAHLVWRRRDPGPELKGIQVTDATSGKKVDEAGCSGVTSEAGDVFFRAERPGEYFIYFLAGDPGGGAFPVAKYLPAVAPTAALTHPDVEASVVRWEARTEHDRFNEMEIVATHAESEAFLAEHSGQPFQVFPESREHSVRMFDHLPEIWLKRAAAPEFSVHPNEFFPFQLGVWAGRGALENLRVTFSDFTSSTGARIPAAALRCLQTSGTNWDNRPIVRTINLPAGHVQPLWCALDLNSDVTAGRFTGTAEISADGQPAQRVALTFTVAGPPLPDRGDSDPARLSKLRWLDSTLAQDDTPANPYTPIQVSGRSIALLGRTITLGDDGLPQRIATFFHPGVTRLVPEPTELLDGPMHFVVELADGRILPLTAFGFRYTKTNDGVAEWTATLKGADITIELRGRAEFDGQVQIRTTLTAAKSLTIHDIRLELPRTTATTPLILGLGHYGGASPASDDCKWDVAKKNQDGVWLGTANAGLRVQLRAENYVRPYINIHYIRQPLNAPTSWENGGKGGIRFERGEKLTPLVCYSGERILSAGTPLHFDFDLSITPFHLLNNAAQWTDRYYHVGGLTDATKVAATGANVVNVHQGNAGNPYINYPFLTAGKLAAYAETIHARKMRVKYYYTVRELSTWTSELFAVRAFGDELIARGKGAGQAWCEEHLGGQYWQAWAEPAVNDSSILTRSMSRWNNFYLEGLDWLVKNAGCDGLYLDDISYDRTVLKRARKILDRSPLLQARGGGLIDLHSWNESVDSRAGYASCALLFMDSLPYVDRMWFGEGHPYDGPPEQTLAAVSGIPFGLMGEMLEGGGNPWLGLTFGMTGRLGWGGHPEEVWKQWDEFGVSDAEFIGWWNPESPVHADNPNVKVTLWKKTGQTLVAVANFSDKPVRTKLACDWQALQLDPANSSLYAPAMDNFQPGTLLRPDAPLPLAPKRGLLLWLDEKKRDAPATVATLALDRRRTLFEERFVPKAGDGWMITAKDHGAIQFDGQGEVFLAAANTHAWTSHPVPDDARVIAAQVRQDAGDHAQQWGPGLALVWPEGKTVKVNRRDDGRFGVSVNGQERLAGLGDRELPVTLAIAFDEKRVRVLASGEGAFQQEQELASLPRAGFPGAPKELRIGKMANSLEPTDHDTPGEMGWSRVDWVKIYGEAAK